MFKKLRTIGKHVGYMLCLGISLLYSFFYIVLPRITRQGKTVKVPDLTGLSVDALDSYISQYRLRYTITDQDSYSEQYPPFTVIQQVPAAGTLVKENRRIYLVLNAQHPPQVAMPNLIEVSLKEAKLILENKGLQLDNIIYVPDIAQYAVLEQRYNGHPIPTGKKIPIKSKIDVVVGAGLGTQMIEVPDVTHMALEEAQLVLLECGMCMGVSHYVNNQSVAVGHVFRQNPMPGTKVKVGTAISLWIADL